MEKAVGVVAIVLAAMCPIFCGWTMSLTHGKQDETLFFGWMAIEIFWGLGGAYILTKGGK